MKMEFKNKTNSPPDFQPRCGRLLLFGEPISWSGEIELGFIDHPLRGTTARPPFWSGSYVFRNNFASKSKLACSCGGVFFCDQAKTEDEKLIPCPHAECCKKCFAYRKHVGRKQDLDAEVHRGVHFVCRIKEICCHVLS